VGGRIESSRLPRASREDLGDRPRDRPYPGGAGVSGQFSLLPRFRLSVPVPAGVLRLQLFRPVREQDVLQLSLNEPWLSRRALRSLRIVPPEHTIEFLGMQGRRRRGADPA
jgi:hypothetical protein